MIDERSAAVHAFSPVAVAANWPSAFVDLGIEVLEARRHLAGLDRGNVLLGQISGPNDPTIGVGRLAPLDRMGSPAVAGGVLFCFA